MFGYIRARQDLLSQEMLTEYESVYCGLCHTMGERHGQFSRLFLNYDFVLLAMLLAPAGEEPQASARRCAAHPFKCRTCCRSEAWLQLAADESVILTWWKLQDNRADGGLFTGLAARGAQLGLRRGYCVAKKACPDFDRNVESCLAELRRLERENCPSVDRTGDCFARLLCAAAPATGMGEKDRPMEQFLYHVGRWIYLIDAVDDLEDDRKAGRYNPIAARFPSWDEDSRAQLRRTMDHSLALAGSAFQLLEVNHWTPLIENMLYGGLPGVEELVFSGRWRDYQKRHRRNNP